MEYCCHVWAGAPSCYLELLDKLEKQHFLNWKAQLVPLPFSCGRSTCYSNRLHDLSDTIPRCQQFLYLHSLALEFPCL